MKKRLPPIWLLVLIVGLPILSETIYSPSLPDIANTLKVSDSWVEFTLTIYLAGFALGTLFWGRLSDRLGRKPCALLGILIFVLGSIGCYFSDSIILLLISRFVQSFGGSTGSVLGQAISRDAFRGVERGKVYSTVGGALAFSPAIGPFIGGMVDQTFGWPSIFLLLIIAGAIVFFVTAFKLPETHLERTSSFSLRSLTKTLSKDLRVIGFGIIVAAINGMHFSYYAEAPFYYIDLLGLSPSVYGLTFIALAIMGVMGASLSRFLHNHLTSKDILWRGILIFLMGTGCFVLSVFLGGFFSIPPFLTIIFSIGSMAIVSMGSAMIMPNCLSLALEDYQHAVGTASSLFGFFYYALTSLFTLGMGILHNDTLYPMPFYFSGIGLLILAAFLTLIEKKNRGYAVDSPS